MGLGGEIAKATRPHGVFHAEHHPHAVGFELHQDHRERRPSLSLSLQPAIEGPIGWSQVHRRQSSAKPLPQPVELQLLLLDREFRRILRPHGTDGLVPG